MLRIAGKTAGPIELKFLWTLMGGGGCYRLKNLNCFFSNCCFYFSTGSSASTYIKSKLEELLGFKIVPVMSHQFSVLLLSYLQCRNFQFG